MKKFDGLQIALLSFAALILILSFAISTPWYSPIITLLAVAVAAVILWRIQIEQTRSPSGSAAHSPHAETGFIPMRSTVNFTQVAGLKSAREELDEIVDYFKNPAKYKKFGVVLPRGVLLAGPPGVGKTLIAKAIAGEAGVPFFYASGSSFAHLYVGVGPQKVRELFASARRNAPSIVFIDEIDAVGKSRGGSRGDERENTLNQLLTEMDGFESASGVVVLAATNRIEMLDAALLRPGRFDRRIEVGLPSAADRREILAIAFRGKPHSLDLAKIAERTVGFSGAALAVLANEAALHAIKRNAESVEIADFEAIKDKVISLKKSGELLDDKDREKLSLYQAAKAIAAKRLGLVFEAAKLDGSFLPHSDAIAGESELFALAAARLAGLAWWRKTGESGANFCESDGAEARAIALRYLAIYDPTGAEGGAERLMEKAMIAAAERLDAESIARVAAVLREHESAPFEVL